MVNSRFEAAEASNAAELRQQLARQRTDLTSNATFLTFDPGLYAIDFRTTSASMSDVGLPLPCARLEPVNMPSSRGRAFVSMLPDGGWLSRQTTTAHVLVVGGKAGAVLTIYRPADGSAMPEVHFRSVLAASAATSSADAPAATTPSTAARSVVGLMVHVQGRGDQTNLTGDWAGDIQGNRLIEGFSITLPEGMSTTDLEYQGIMGEDWRTPWFEAGVFCGSRGLQLPLLGFRLRLVGEAAEKFDCLAWGHFGSQGEIGPVKNGEDCEADRMPLMAMKVEVTPKAAPADTPTPPAPAEAPLRRALLRRKPKSP